MAVPLNLTGAARTQIADRVVDNMIARVEKTVDEMMDAGIFPGINELDGSALVQFFINTLIDPNTGELNLQDVMLLSELDEKGKPTYLDKFMAGEAPLLQQPYWQGLLSDTDLFEEQIYKFKKTFGSLRPLR